MSFCEVRFTGAAANKACGMNVILPDAGEGPFPVLYLLHGYSDDHTIWCRRTRLEWYVREMPLIVVMPDGLHSFYCNDPRPGGFAGEDHIIADVVGFVERAFPALAEREGRALAGLSMGGYGSMMLALRHPEMFCAVSSHSSAFDFAHKPIAERHEINTFAAALPDNRYDCFVLAAQAARAGNAPAIRFDCGTEDFLLASNRDFHAHLDAVGLAHQYAEFPGQHNWDYWDEHVQQTLRFVAEHLRMP
ncbi:MAG TPA: alpha/beta hydrolase family protein [Phycisphaerae bacterium]|nr:alpha/beta hydrolase family protein [Phycisphaerae bacterium]